MPTTLLLLFSLISGTVLDPATHLPVPGAHVTILSSPPRTVSTSSTGQFHLSSASLPAHLRVTAMGYIPLDTTVTDTLVDLPLRKATSLVPVVVRALRSPKAPSTRTTLTDTTELHAPLRDLPSLLSQTPSATFTSDNGTGIGYSYMRLRGMDHNRINMTLDGIPVNEPEDEGAYFSNFPGIMGALKSIDVQRGVGASTLGSASYAGAINLETLDPHTTRNAITSSWGSWGSTDQTVRYATRLPLDFSLVTYLDAQRTQGYRAHAGYQGQSGYLSLLKETTTSSVRFVTLAGNEHTGLSYLPSSDSALRADPRDNPLRPDERDHFSEQMSYLTATSNHGHTTVTSTLFHTTLRGNYDVYLDPMMNFAINSRWSGLATELSSTLGPSHTTLGLFADTYARSHSASLLSSPDLYKNTGHKETATGWAKTEFALSYATLSANAELRHTHFSYAPSTSSVSLRPISWTFFNSKVGLALFPKSQVNFYATYAHTSREPTRNDMFQGFDDIDTTNVALVSPLHGVRPEHVNDLELGLHYTSPSFQATLTGFSMQFHDEIASIGQLSYIGLPLRKNVAHSKRTGIETSATFTRGPLELSEHTTLMRGTLHSYTNDATGVTYHDTEPLLTPRLQSSHTITWHTGPVRLSYEGTYTSQSYLDNGEDRRFTLPPSYIASTGASASVGPAAFSFSARNLLNRHTYTSGSTDGTTSYYFPLAPRTLIFTTSLSW